MPFCTRMTRIRVWIARTNSFGSRRDYRAGAIKISERLVLADDRPKHRRQGQRRSMLVLRSVVAFFNGVLLAHVLAVFCLSVKAGTFLMIDVGRRIYPDLTIASTGCRSCGCDRWSLGAGYRRSSRSRRRLSSGSMSMRLFRRRGRARTRRSVLSKG
jgi:hypothetical protein